MSHKPGLKKRRAPLPEEIYPELAKETNVPDVSCESTTTERRARTLPIGKPAGERRNSLSEELTSRRHTYSSVANSGISKATRTSTDDINFLSDNEALDVRSSSDNVKALINAPKNGHKRHSSGDVSKLLKSSASRSSLGSPNLSERSFSLNSVTSWFSTDYVESQMVDQEDIITLTVHVRNFSDALSKLRNVFSGNGSDTESDEFTDSDKPGEEMQVKAHECLGNVLANLKEVIHQYPSLQSSEILVAAGHLISKVKSHNYEENKIPDDFYQFIDQLALVFSSSISDFLMGDQELSPTKTGDDGDDCGDEFAEDGDDDMSEGDMLDESLNLTSKQEPLNDILRDKDADLDRVLLRMESGVDFCLQWTKCWSKYVKDIASYVEKRAQLEAEYTKQLTKLAQATRTSIYEENYLPFQSTFFTALDQDLEYSHRCQQTLSSISGSKFMEPLMQRRSVHDRARKDMKDEWTKMSKQLQDSVSSVKTTQNMYYKRKQELEKLNTRRQDDVKDTKEDSSSVYSVFGTNKSKKEEELRQKVEEAKQFYSNAVRTANETQAEAEKTKVRIVTQTKQLVNECDRTFRSVTRKYFDMMHDLAVPTPIHFKTLAESCQGYEPGKQFEDFVRFQQSTARSANPLVIEFQPYSNIRTPSGPLPNDLESPAKHSQLKPWPLSAQLSDGDFGPSPAVSPSSSPQPRKKTTNGRLNVHPPPSTDDESGDEMKSEKEQCSKSRRPVRQKRRPKTPANLHKLTLSRDASTHIFRKIRSPTRCSQCEGYVFYGFECAQCGLSCHKKCLENLFTACSHSRQRPSPTKRMTTFGVGLTEDGGVPVLVTKCVNEINRRGLRVKGIYRVSGVKSKMENLCQEFETNADAVDPSTQPPHLIASVLKLYIRQLPDPLMTTKLYPELIQLAKETSNLNGLTYDEYDNEKDRSDFKKLLERLQELLEKLPRSHYLTTATLIKHLHKVSVNEQYNQMSPQNLAIVFGPTILRLDSENSTTSLSSLVDMPHQTRIVALLIVNPQLFGDAGEVDTEQTVASDADSEKNEELNLPDTPVEKFVSPKKEEGARMPDLYGLKSDRVRGEGLSPMDKLTSDTHETTRIDRRTSKTNERLEVKGEATSVFDEAAIFLPGSLERKDKILDWTQDDEDLSEREIDTGQLPTHGEQQHVIGDDGRSSLKENLLVVDELHGNATLSMSPNGSLVKEIEDEINKNLNARSPEGSLVKEIEDEANKNLNAKTLVESSNIVDKEHDEETLSSGSREQDEDRSYPRLRAKAFSVGKRSSDPEMLAKRGSALMNAFIGDNSKSEDSETSPRGSPTRKALNGLRGAFDDASGEEKLLDMPEGIFEAAHNGESTVLSSTVTSATLVQSEGTEPVLETTASRAKDDIPDIRERAVTSGASSAVSSKSGDELSTFIAEGTTRRKRSATYDNDIRRMFENRQEKGERRVTSDRVLAYAIRSGRKSVKDQIKQLEQRENSETTRVLPLLTVRRNSLAGKHESENSSSNALSNIDKNDGKNSLNVSGHQPEKQVLRAHEPLSRVRVKGGHVDSSVPEAVVINPPRSPVTHRPPVDEKFCALKMDINLESPRAPSSDSSGDSSDDNDVVRGTPLNTWAGRGLTPRDSNHAPEFV